MTSHDTLNEILNIKINDKVFTNIENNEILVAAVKSIVEKCRETVFEENITVSQTSEEDKMTGDQDFSDKENIEEEWDKILYENITKKKCGSDTDDEMESTDDPETVT